MQRTYWRDFTFGQTNYTKQDKTHTSTNNRFWVKTKIFFVFKYFSWVLKKVRKKLKTSVVNYYDHFFDTAFSFFLFKGSRGLEFWLKGSRKRGLIQVLTLAKKQPVWWFSLLLAFCLGQLSTPKNIYSNYFMTNKIFALLGFIFL